MLRNIGGGRAFYSVIGHRPESYTRPPSARLLEHGIAWTMRLDGIHEVVLRRPEPGNRALHLGKCLSFGVAGKRRSPYFLSG